MTQIEQAQKKHQEGQSKGSYKALQGALQSLRCDWVDAVGFWCAPEKGTRIQKSLKISQIRQHKNFIQDWQYGASVHAVKNVRIGSKIWHHGGSFI